MSTSLKFQPQASGFDASGFDASGFDTDAARRAGRQEALGMKRRALDPALAAMRRRCSRRFSTLADIKAAMTGRPAKLITDYLTPMPSHLLSTTLADLAVRRSGSRPGADSSWASTSSAVMEEPARELPQGHHLVYLPLQTAASGLAADGADADHVPGREEEFARRLWAGGEVIFNAGWRRRLLLDGRAWRCSETVEDVSAGRHGSVFVRLRRRYGLGHGLDGEGPWDVEETRTLVFMRDAEQQRPPSVLKFPQQATSSVTLLARPLHLFHFSALTLNAHAIHYDPLYARVAAGHPALLVHGPLTLALMLRLLGGAVVRLTYRNLAPLYAGDEMRVCARRAGPHSCHVWVEGPAGRLAVKGVAEMEDAA